MQPLPQFFPERRNLPSVKLPLSTPEDFGGGIGQAVGELGKTLEGIRSHEEALKADQVLTGAALGLEEAKIRVDQKADADNYLSLWQDEENRVKQTASEVIQTFSSDKRASATIGLDRILATHRINALHAQAQRSIDYQRAGGLKSLDTLARLAANDPEPAGRERWLEMGADTIVRLQTNNVLSDTEGFEWLTRFKGNIKKERVAYFATGVQDQLDNLQNQALRDPVNAANYFQRGANLIEEATSDWLPKEKRAEVESKFRSVLWFGAVKTKIEEDPYLTQRELKAGKYDRDLTQAGVIELRNEAENEIEKRQRKAEAERKDRERFIGKLVDDYKDAKIAGFPWRGPVTEERLALMAKGTEHETDFNNVRAASKILGQFNLLSPMEQEQYLRGSRTGAKSGVEAKFLGTLERAHDATVTGLKSDPLTFAVKQGLIPSPAPLNLDDPVTLRERSRLASVAEQRYGVPVSPLSDDEANQLRAKMEQAPADMRASILQKLRTGLDDRHIKSVAAQFAKKDDKVLAHTMGLSLEAPRVASNILRGQDVIKNDPKIMPQGGDMATARSKIAEQLGPAYQHNPEHFAAVNESALSLYAFKSWQARDYTGILDNKRLDESMREASGGVLTIGGGFFGGGNKIQPPRYGINENQFRWMLDRADYSKAKGLTKDDIKKYGTFESLGDGKYLVKVGPGYMQSDQGPFILDLGNIYGPSVGAK